MASFNAAQSSQTRPTSESNNNNNCNNQKNICTTEDNNQSYGITKKDYEYVKFKQDNIDPGATTTRATTNISANEFVFPERDRGSPNHSDTIEAIAKIIGDNFSAHYWPTENLSSSQANATVATVATVATNATAKTKEEYKLTTAAKSTLNSKAKQNSIVECLSNQGTLFTRLAINAAYTETEFANKEKLKLAGLNVPDIDRRSNSKQSKYDYAINANAKANASGEYVDRHRLLYDCVGFNQSDPGSGAKQEFGDNIDTLRQYYRQLYEFVCAVTATATTTTATIVAFICAIYATANANATTKNTGRHGWDSVDRCRRAHVARVHEWSNAYCYS